MSNFIRRLQRMNSGGQMTVNPVTPSDEPRMYLSPVGGSHANGSTIQVQVRADSGDIDTNAYQANVSYPTGQLEFVSTDTSGSPFTTIIQNVGGGGLVQFSGAVLAGRTSGDQLLGTITFTAVGAGPAALTFADGSGVASADESLPIIEHFDGANYTIT